MSISHHTQTPAGWKWNPPLPIREGDETFHARKIVQSTNECTGLMPLVPGTQSEAESSSKLYAIHCAKPHHHIGDERPNYNR